MLVYSVNRNVVSGPSRTCLYTVLTEMLFLVPLGHACIQCLTEMLFLAPLGHACIQC